MHVDYRPDTSGHAGVDSVDVLARKLADSPSFLPPDRSVEGMSDDELKAALRHEIGQHETLSKAYQRLLARQTRAARLHARLLISVPLGVTCLVLAALFIDELLHSPHDVVGLVLTGIFLVTFALLVAVILIPALKLPRARDARSDRQEWQPAQNKDFTPPQIKETQEAPELALFTLRIEEVPGTDHAAYQVTLLDEQGEAAGPPAPFHLVLDDVDLRRELLSVREMEEGAVQHVRMQATREDDVSLLARRLSGTLFGAPAIRSAWDAHLVAAQGQYRLPCLTLSFVVAPAEHSAQALLTLPWEIVADPATLDAPWQTGQRVPLLCADRGVAIVRQVAGLASVPNISEPGDARAETSTAQGARPLRVLLLIADPRDLPPQHWLDRDQEHDALLNALQPLLQVGLAAPPVVEDTVSLASLRQHLLEDEPYDVLYYTGHGSWDPQRGEGALIIEHDSGTPQAGTTRALYRSDLAAFLAEPKIRARLPQFVCLSGCLTAQETGLEDTRRVAHMVAEEALRRSQATPGGAPPTLATSVVGSAPTVELGTQSGTPSAPADSVETVAVDHSAVGHATAERPHFASVALAFVEAGVPHVLALQASILDEAGLVLSDALFRAVAQAPGATVEYALAQSRAALVERARADALTRAAPAVEATQVAVPGGPMPEGADASGSATAPAFDWEGDEPGEPPLWQRLEPPSDVLAWAIPTLYHQGATSQPLIAADKVRAAVHVPLQVVSGDVSSRPHEPAPATDAPTSNEAASTPALGRLEAEARPALGDLEYLATGYVGRHREQRWLRETLTDPASPVRAVLIYGLGGVGKTVFVTQVVQPLLEEGVFDGAIVVRVHEKPVPTTAEEVLSAADAYLRAHGETGFTGVLNHPQIALANKAHVLARFLATRERGTLLLLDNCEGWVAPDHHTLHDPDVTTLLTALVQGFAVMPDCASRVVLTARYRLDVLPRAGGADSTETTEAVADAANLVEVMCLRDLPSIEAIWLLGRQSSLRGMPSRQRSRVVRALGGHPFTLGLFAARAREHGWQAAYQELPDIVREVNSRRLLLERVYADLPPEAQQLLRRAAWLQRSAPVPLLGALIGWEAGGSDGQDVDDPKPKLDDEATVAVLLTALQAVEDAGLGSLVRVHDDLVADRRVEAILKDSQLILTADAQASNEGAQTLGDAELTGIEDLGTDPADPDDGVHRVRLHLRERELRLDLPVPVREWLRTIDAPIMGPVQPGGAPKATGHAETQPSEGSLGAPKTGIANWDQRMAWRLALIWYRQISREAERQAGVAAAAANLLEAWSYATDLDDLEAALDDTDRLIALLLARGQYGTLRRALAYLLTHDLTESQRAAVQGNLATVVELQGDYGEARRQLEAALATFRDLGDQIGVANQQGNLAILAREQGDYVESRRQSEAALATFRELGDRDGVASQQSNLGLLAGAQGDYVESRRQSEAALATFRELGNRDGMASQQGNLANLARRQGDYAESRRQYEAALATYRELGDRNGVARQQSNLALLAKDQGDYAESRRQLESALATFGELGSRAGVARAQSNLANLAQEQGNYEEARRQYEAALATFLELGDRDGVARQQGNLAILARGQGDNAEARRQYEAALATFRELGARDGVASTQSNLAILARTEGAHGEAETRAFTAAVGFALLQSPNVQISLQQLAAGRAILGATTFAAVAQQVASGPAEPGYHVDHDTWETAIQEILQVVEKAADDADSESAQGEDDALEP